MTSLDQFGLFVHRVDELGQTRLIRSSGLSGDFSFHFDAIRGAAYRFPCVDEDDLRSFLMTFRQFVMPKEPVFIRRVYNLAHKHITSDELRTALAAASHTWAKILKSSGFTLQINGRAITPEYVLDLWINGHYFHNDEQKLAELKSYGMPDILLVRNQFINFLVDAAMVVAHTRNILRAALQDGAISS